MMNEFYSGKLDFLNLYVEFFENKIFSPNQSIHLQIDFGVFLNSFAKLLFMSKILFLFYFSKWGVMYIWVQSSLFSLIIFLFYFVSYRDTPGEQFLVDSVIIGDSPNKGEPTKIAGVENSLGRSFPYGQSEYVYV